MKNANNVTAVKLDCINRFNQYVKYLQKGHQLDYSHILNMICFINSYDELDNKELLTQYLLNYD